MRSGFAHRQASEYALIEVFTRCQALLPGLSDDSCRRLRDLKRLSGAVKQLLRFDIHLPKSLHATNILEHVHAN